MFHLYKVKPNLKNAEPGYLVFKNEVLKFDDITSADLAFRRIQDKSAPLGLRYSVIRLY